jgi:FkbM family methyltransferase
MKGESTMNLTQASKAALLLATNPGLFSRMVAARIGAHRRLPALPARKQINGIWFEYDAVHATAPMYFGSYALALIDLMKRFLHPGDTFLDAGANIGYLSAVGAGLVGTSGQVHSFEPIPRYFQRLQRLAALNPAYKIVANPCAAGDKAGTARAYLSSQPGETTLVPDYTQEEAVEESVEVPVIRLDHYIESHSLANITLIKIDTEGFEFPVLLGMQRFFERAERLPAILCEIDPRAFPLLGHKAADLTKYMGQYGYQVRKVVSPSRSVDLTALTHVDDVLFLPPSARGPVAAG